MKKTEVTVHGKKKKPQMHADKRRYLNSGFASAFIGVHLRLSFFLGVVARELLARERLQTELPALLSRLFTGNFPKKKCESRTMGWPANNFFWPNAISHRSLGQAPRRPRSISIAPCSAEGHSHPNGLREG